MGMHCVKQQMTQIPQNTANTAIVILHPRSKFFSAADNSLSKVTGRTLRRELTNAQVEEDDGRFDNEDIDVVQYFDCECCLHRIRHFLKGQSLPTETHAIISKDPYRDQVANC
jgi:hypothetical protein